MSAYCTKCGQLGHLYVHCPTKFVIRKPDNGEVSAGDDQPPQEPDPALSDPEVSTSPAQRVKNWRKDNPDRYREYMREYMRRRRAGG